MVTETVRETPPAPVSSAPNEGDASSSAQAQPSGSAAQQAEPLPKKRRIQPVMVEAPCSDVLVEDTVNCVYPNPPAYSDVIQVEDAASPSPHPGDHDNRGDAERSGQANKTTPLRRFLTRYSPRRHIEFWRSVFKRPGESPPFHELEEQLEDDDDDIPTSSAVDDEAAMTSSAATRNGNDAPTKKTYSEPFPGVVNDGCEFSDDDDELLLLSDARDPVELRVFCRDESGTSAAGPSWFLTVPTVANKLAGRLSQKAFQVLSQ